MTETIVLSAFGGLLKSHPMDIPRGYLHWKVVKPKKLAEPWTGDVSELCIEEMVFVRTQDRVELFSGLAATILELQQ